MWFGVAPSVFGNEVLIWCAFCRVFGFCLIESEAGLLHVLLDDGRGFFDKVGGDADVQVVEVCVCDCGGISIDLLVLRADLLDVVLDL